MSKHIIIYHDHCNDGFGAAFIAHQHLVADGHEVTMFPFNYGDMLLTDEASHEATLHILDFSFPPSVMLALCTVYKEVVWLDHHKTAIDAWFDSGVVCPQNLYYWLTDNHSGTMLAWLHYEAKLAPTLKEALESAPHWIKLIDDRDRWVFQYPETKAFHAGLGLMPRDVKHWEVLASQKAVDLIVNNGGAILSYQKMLYEQLMETAHEITIDGIKGLAANIPGQFASDVGHLLCKKSGTFGATYHSNGKGYKFSIRSEGDFDVAAIAKAFGGGGHRNAAGFSLEHPVDVAASGLVLWSTVDELTSYAIEAGAGDA